MKNERTGSPPDFKAIKIALYTFCLMRDGWLNEALLYFKIKLLLMNADINCQTLKRKYTP